LTTLITNDDNGAEAEFFTTFDNFTDSTDLDYPFLPSCFFFFLLGLLYNDP